MPDESEVRAFQVDLREPGSASRGGPGKRAGMSTAEVRLALAECGRLPEGRPRAQRLESLAAEVRRTGDGPLEAEVLLALSRAYEYSAERERMAVPFARLLQLLDRFPAELGPMSLTIHWQLKWMTVGLIRNPAVPLETAQRWLDELDHRYRQRGFSPRPVHMLRWLLAQGSGDEAAAAAEVDAWITAPRDQMADCQACERNDWGTWRAYLGDDSGALGYWAPLLDGELKCAEEPHRVLAKALLPLARTGRAEEARDAFLRGYPLARHNISLYGRSLTGTGQHAEAAREFLEAARLVQDDADQAAHARLAGAAAEALQRAGQNAEALAAYQRAAQLFGDLGHVVARARCLRSAAWLQFEAADADDPDGEVLGVTTMRAVLAELESLPADGSPPELDTELTVTRTQLGQMLASPQAGPRLTPASSGEDEDGGEPGLPAAA